MLEALIDERHKRGVPVHRLISFCQGGTLFDRAELKDFAQMAAEDKMEVIAVPGPRNAWDTGRQFITSDGQRCGGLNHRGSDEVRKVLADMLEMYEMGFRGFMLVDWGVMAMVKQLQEMGDFPRDIAIKLSVWAGVSSACGARLAQDIGVSSFNPVSDLSLPQMASIRTFHLWWVPVLYKTGPGKRSNDRLNIPYCNRKGQKICRYPLFLPSGTGWKMHRGSPIDRGSPVYEDIDAPADIAGFPVTSLSFPPRTLRTP